MYKKWFSVAVILTVVTGLASFAQEFSGDVVSIFKGQSTTSKMYFEKDKWRMESEFKGAKSVSIIRKDKKLMWNLMPDQKMYMEMAIPEQQMTGVSKTVAGEISRKKIGNERVNGMPCDKFEISHKNKVSGKTEVLYQWLSRDGIPVKTAAQDGSWSSELKNIKMGRSPKTLFEIPAGYTKQKMPAGMGKMMGPGGKLPAKYQKMMQKMGD